MGHLDEKKLKPVPILYGEEKDDQLLNEDYNKGWSAACTLEVKNHLHLMSVWQEREWRALLSLGNRNLLAQGIAADSQFLNLIAGCIIIKSIM